MRRNDTALINPPLAEISAVKFLPALHGGEERYLAVTSWDGSVRIYDFKRNAMLMKCDTEKPLLALCATGPTTVAFGGIEKKLYVLELNNSGGSTGTAILVGSHEDTICVVEYSSTYNFIVTGSWDRSIRLWSPKPGQGCVGTISTDNKKVFCMNVRDNLVAAGLEDEVIGIWDLRNYNSPLRLMQVKDSLNLQCIGIFADMQRIVYGTVEGKASIESINQEMSRSDFLFKPHVDKAKGIAHPVNAVCCIENTSKFLMGGSEGKACIWDPDKRKLVVEFAIYPNEIAAADVSKSGKHAAVACCWLDDRDAKKEEYDIPPPALYIRNISDYVRMRR